MDKTEFLLLPASERKRLAAQRSLERTKARKEGKPIPLTLSEEFGLPTRQRKEPKAEPKKTPPKKVPPKKQEKRDLTTSLVAPPKQTSGKMIRTILGDHLHWTIHTKETLGWYNEKAKAKGQTVRIPYNENKTLKGYVYGEFSKEDWHRLRAILVGSNRGNISFDKPEKV